MGAELMTSAVFFSYDQQKIKNVIRRRVPFIHIVNSLFIINIINFKPFCFMQFIISSSKSDFILTFYTSTLRNKVYPNFFICFWPIKRVDREWQQQWSLSKNVYANEPIMLLITFIYVLHVKNKIVNKNRSFNFITFMQFDLINWQTMQINDTLKYAL